MSDVTATDCSDPTDGSVMKGDHLRLVTGLNLLRTTYEIKHHLNTADANTAASESQAGLTEM